MTTERLRPDPFREALQAAADLIGSLEELVSDGGQTIVLGRDKYPEATLSKLRVQAVFTYAGILRLLDEPLTAFAAEPLLRVLLEAFAHLVWIHDGEKDRPSAAQDICLGDNSVPGCTPERRAVCLDLGIWSSLNRALGDALPESFDEGAPAAVAEKLDRLIQLHAAMGCVGRGRTNRDVRPILRSLRGISRVTWAYDLWKVSSGVAHLAMPGRDITHVDGEEVHGGPAPDEFRHSLFTWSSTVFANFYSGLIHLLAPTKLPQVSAAMQGLRGKAGGYLQMTSDWTYL